MPVGNNTKKEPRKIKSVGKWNVGKKLGDGTGGSVYEAINDDIKVRAALKVISLDDEDVKFRTVREQSILKKLRHPNIIHCYDTYVVKDLAFIIMEFADTDLLNYLWTRGSMTEREARGIARALVDAISYCHENGVSHRDIKLENILLCKGKVKLADFGFAIQQDQDVTALFNNPSLINTNNSNGIAFPSPKTLSTKPLEEFKEWATQTFCGSLHYAAPELFQRLEGYDPRKVDCWALGVCIYGMVALSMPFIHDGNNDRRFIVANIVYGRYDKQPLKNCDCSAELLDLISGLLTVDISERFTMRMAKKHPWFALEDQPLSMIIASTSYDDLMSLKTYREKQQQQQANAANPTNANPTNAIPVPIANNNNNDATVSQTKPQRSSSYSNTNAILDMETPEATPDSTPISTPTGKERYSLDERRTQPKEKEPPKRRLSCSNDSNVRKTRERSNTAPDNSPLVNPKERQRATSHEEALAVIAAKNREKMNKTKKPDVVPLLTTIPPPLEEEEVKPIPNNTTTTTTTTNSKHLLAKSPRLSVKNQLQKSPRFTNQNEVPTIPKLKDSKDGKLKSLRMAFSKMLQRKHDPTATSVSS